MLESLAQGFRILAKHPSARSQEIERLRNHFSTIPEEFIDLVKEATEVELQYQKDHFLRLWRPEGCLDMDQGYGITKRIPGALPVGDNEGGKVIFYLDGHQGYGLYLTGFGNLDAEDAIWLAPSLKDLLENGTGADKL